LILVLMDRRFPDGGFWILGACASSVDSMTKNTSSAVVASSPDVNAAHVITDSKNAVKCDIDFSL
jgi:hypothetical protein